MTVSLEVETAEAYMPSKWLRCDLSVSEAEQGRERLQLGIVLELPL